MQNFLLPYYEKILLLNATDFRGYYQVIKPKSVNPERLFRETPIALMSQLEPPLAA